MNCYECQTQDNRVSSAVAVCSQCGAATCTDHTRVGHPWTRTHNPGASHVHEVPGRRLFCSTCAAELDGAGSVQVEAAEVSR